MSNYTHLKKYPWEELEKAVGSSFITEVSPSTQSLIVSGKKYFRRRNMDHIRFSVTTLRKNEDGSATREVLRTA